MPRSSAAGYFTAALGLVYILRSLVQILWGKEWLSLPSPFLGSIVLGGASITYVRVFIFSLSYVVMILLSLFIYRTWLGKGIRAVSQSESGTALVGINANRMNGLTFAISAALAACAGILLGHVTFVHPAMGFSPLLKGFAMIIIGGMGSIPGAIIGGFFLGVIETLSIAFLSAEYSDIMESLLKRVKVSGITMCVIEHKMKFVMGLSDRVTFLNEGQKIAEGTPDEVSKDKKVIAAYLGEEK